jgi:glutathione S-transferase
MPASNYTLVIGDKNFSSWSLRPWIALKYFGIPFAEERVRLRQPESKAEILRHSPSGKVPALKDGNRVIWESLAILDYLAEEHPEHCFWPKDEDALAEARSVSAEMHSGFATLRNEMSMDLLARVPSPAIGEALECDIRRIVAIWRGCRCRHGTKGSFLLGAFSNADAMFAPVATRFRTFGVDLARFGDDGGAQNYADTILALAAMAEWTAGAEAEMKERASASLALRSR